MRKERRHEHKESEVVKECIPSVEVQDPGQDSTHKCTKSSPAKDRNNKNEPHVSELEEVLSRLGSQNCGRTI